MQHVHILPAIVTCLALLVYLWNTIMIPGARRRTGISAPATTGNPDFERQFRVQQNMVEQLIIFIPSLWLFCLTVQVLVGAALGAIFILGRILYSVSYAKDASKRGPGFGIGMIANLILLIGGLIGAVRLYLMGV